MRTIWLNACSWFFAACRQASFAELQFVVPVPQLLVFAWRGHGMWRPPYKTNEWAFANSARPVGHYVRELHFSHAL